MCPITLLERLTIVGSILVKFHYIGSFTAFQLVYINVCSKKDITLTRSSNISLNLLSLATNPT